MLDIYEEFRNLVAVLEEHEIGLIALKQLRMSGQDLDDINESLRSRL